MAVGFALLVLAGCPTTGRLSETEAADARMNGSIVELLTGLPVLKVFEWAEEALGETRRVIDHSVTHPVEWSREYFPLGTAFSTVVTANVVVILTVGMALSRVSSSGASASMAPGAVSLCHCLVHMFDCGTVEAVVRGIRKLMCDGGRISAHRGVCVVWLCSASGWVARQGRGQLG
ncbi:MAG: hypothetical protein ACRD0K_27645 [Egibacteraceae bacterium]